MAKKETKDLGFDGVIVTASTSNSEPLILASKAAKRRGKIVLVGLQRLNLIEIFFMRKNCYFKSVNLMAQVDTILNMKKKEMIILAYVRWTENRNIEAVLRAMELGNLDVKPLISDSFEFKHIFGL